MTPVFTPLQIDAAPVAAHDRCLEDKLADLDRLLGGLGRVLIGYSGGVDSATLVVAAHRVLGDDVIAVTADSESYAEGELEMAAAILQRFGIRHEVVRTRELDNGDYASNPVDRCYHCKSELFTRMSALAESLGVQHLLYGHNADDVGDFRPGAVAARRFGVRAPLKEAGLTKSDVRELARRWHLPVWNRPAAACLSSRIPYGTPVTAEALRRVDRAEQAVRARGFEGQLRVRHHDEVARIELPADDLARLLADGDRRHRLAEALTRLGYARVTADLQGFRSGSLNEVLGGDQTDDAHSAPRALADAVEGLGLAPVETGEAQRVCWLRLEDAAAARLADVELRAGLAAAARKAGARYVAIDLSRLDSSNPDLEVPRAPAGRDTERR